MVQLFEDGAEFFDSFDPKGEAYRKQWADARGRLTVVE